MPSVLAGHVSSQQQNTLQESMERLEILQQDIKFINNLLSKCDMEAPFPFSRLIADPSTCTGSDLYAIESAVRTLISLLQSKQVNQVELFEFAFLERSSVQE